MPSQYTLGRHEQQFIDELLQSGRYSSASEVIHEGLRVLEQRQQAHDAKLDALRLAICEGFASGESERLDMEALKSEARLKTGGHGR